MKSIRKRECQLKELLENSPAEAPGKDKVEEAECGEECCIRRGGLGTDEKRSCLTEVLQHRELRGDLLHARLSLCTPTKRRIRL
jgi:hypothetical protein